MRWRPRSILQLILLGFLTVVAPLSAAVVLTVQTLVEQAVDNARLNERTVTLTRSTQQLQSDLLDLERRTRQYATLGDASLLRLVLEGLDDLQATLATIGERLDAGGAVVAARLGDQLRDLQHELTLVPGDAARLETALALFDPISREAQAAGRSSRLQVDAELAAQLLAADATRTRMILIACALALLTVPLALLFTYLINQPIRQLEQVIRQLGSARAGGAIRIQGPREMQLLGRQLSWLRDQLAELDAQKQQFLRHISHELKTPLASLCEGADLLAEGVVGPALNPAQREIVSIVQQNSKELQRLIENLLDYNQLLHRADVRPCEVALAPLVGEIVDSHRLGLKRHGLAPVLRDEQAHWVLDAGKLRAALDNLVSNAANYASQDSEVLIHWRGHRDMLEIDVANHGSLIPADETERIFEPFFQGSTGRRGAIKGSGIGLSVARECIESQGGSLRLMQRKPYSTCFRITLPRLEEPA